MQALSRYCNRASINIAATGALLAAVSGIQYKIYALFLVNTTIGTTLQFLDGAAALTGTITMSGTNQLILPFTGEPWFICTQGNAFNLTLGASTQVSGHLLWNN